MEKGQYFSFFVWTLRCIVIYNTEPSSSFMLCYNFDCKYKIVSYLWIPVSKANLIGVFQLLLLISHFNR